METTKNLNLPYLHQNQAMKEIVINEAFTKIDNLIANYIIKKIKALPTDAKNGDLYLFEEKIDDLTNKSNANKLALFSNNKWEILNPSNKMIFYCESLNKFVVFKDLGWKIIAH